MQLFRTGELAKRTGLTTRTLHHYDEIGLLVPSHRTASGYRLYGPDDVARLQQIVSLRQIGLPLEEIREFLKRPDASVKHVVALHLARVKEQVERQRAVVRLLETLEKKLESAVVVSAEEFLITIEAMIMYEKYYTPEQLKWLEARGREIGQDRIEQVQKEWPELIAQVRAEMKKGTDPKDPVVQRLAEKWNSLIREFTGGDAGITRSLERLYAEEPSARERAGVDAEVAEYIARAGA
jgi:DNA-binding transcriptional MerR regulator